MSSLRAQLAALAQANPDSNKLDSVARRDSYIYSPSQAGKLSSDQIHQIGIDGLLQLITSDQEFQKFRHPLFGEAAKRIDRTLLDQDAASELKQHIDGLLYRLAPHILTKPSAYVIEWLVRRFRIHEFDVPTLVSIFLPYYATPQFMAILNILRLGPHSYLAFLKPVQKSRTGLPQKTFMDSLVESSELLRYVAQILPTYMKFNPKNIHQPLLGFHLATFLGLFKTLASRATFRESFPQPVLAAILPSILNGLKTPIMDVKMTTYILLTKLALSSVLEIDLLNKIIHSVIDNCEEYPSEGPNKSVSGMQWRDHDEALLKTVIIMFQCNHHQESLSLTAKSCHTLASVSNSSKLFMHLCQSIELSAFWTAFIQGLAKSALKDHSNSADILLSLSQMFIDPTPALELTARELLSCLASLETPHPALLRPLAIISQRHPEILEKLAKDLIVHTDADFHQSIQNVLRLVSGDVIEISQDDHADILELSSSSAILRQSALRRILEHINSSGSKHPTDLIGPAIKAALKDSDPDVAQVLFAYPDAINHSTTPDEILSAATFIFSLVKPPRLTCMAWISFLTGPFLTNHPEMATRMAEDIMLSRIFWTKSHAKATAGLWSSGLVHRPDAWKGTILESIEECATTSEDPADRIAANEVMLKVVSDGALRLGNSSIMRLLNMLKLKHDSPLARLVPLMILHRAVDRLSQPLLCQLVNTIIDHVLYDADRGSFERWLNLSIGEVEQKVDAIRESFYSRSNSEKVFHRLAADTLLRALLRIRRPADAEYCWFEMSAAHSGPKSNESSSPLATDVVKLHYRLYRLGHAGGQKAKRDSFGRAVLVSLLRALLGEESLTFLARIWTSSSYEPELKIMALMDAAAEVGAVSAPSAKQVKGMGRNYQLLIPSVLIGLTDPVRSVRAAALEVISSIKSGLPSLKSDNQSAPATESDIYAYDRFYGRRASTDLQYLSTSDSNHLVKTIFDSKDEILLDGLSQVRMLLNQNHATGAPAPSPASSYQSNSGEKVKKVDDTAFKRKVLCFLMKVVNCWEDWYGRVKLLKCLTDVSDSLRMHYVSPLLQQIVQGTGLQFTQSDPTSTSLAREYATLLLEAFSLPTKSLKTGKDSASYGVFVGALECLPQNEIQRSLNLAALERLERNLFLDFCPSHREDVLRRVLTIAASDRDSASAYIACLRKLPIDTFTYTRVLTSVASQLPTKPFGSHKKAKTNTGVKAQSSSSTSSDLSTLSLFLEMVPMDRLTQNYDLFAVLLNTLRVLLANHNATNSDINFPAQLLITGMTTTVAKLKPDTFKADGIQLSSIVDYMRISLDPHVSQQAILLMAELARLCPDQTCQSMMPIFTFVGTHVIQRDDAFSARVVDRAIRALIPPIVQSVRDKGTTRVQLIIHLRELLMMFVGARNHIPKHRRTRLFVRLVEVLGPYHFLGAIIMLLVDAGVDESGFSSTIDLALSIWESFPGEICVAALAHFGAEIETLLDQSNTGELNVLPPRTDPDAIVEDGDTNQYRPDRAVGISRAKLLMRFIDQALNSKSMQSKLDAARATQNTDADQVLAFFMVQLLEISQPYPTLTLDEQAQEGRAIARKVARLVALPFFARVLLPKVQNDNDRLVSCALDLLRTRLPLVKLAHREEIEESLQTAIAACGKRINVGIVGSSESEPHLSLFYAVETIGEIALHSTSSEQSALSQLYLPMAHILTSSSDPRLTCAILSVLCQLLVKLGPRLLPHIRFTITTCASLVKGVLTAEHGNAQQITVVQKTFELMNVTVQKSTSFILPYLSTIIHLLIDRDINQVLSRPSFSTIEKGRGTLLRTLTKAVPLDEIHKALSNIWSTVDICRETTMVLLDLLLRAIKHAKVSDAIKESKSIFNFLLLIFDLRTQYPKRFDSSTMIEIESSGCEVFLSLVLKLNDNTLKPLLLRLIDWATMSSSNEVKEDGIHPTTILKSIPMYRVFAAFLNRLQTLGVPYYSHLLDHTTKMLNGFAQGEIECDELWIQVTGVLEIALAQDQDGFWTMTRLSKVTRPMISQLKLMSKHDESIFGDQLKTLLVKLSKRASEYDTLLKVFNTGILDELRTTEDVRVKLIGLSVLEAIWSEMGSALVSFVPETVGGYLVEAMEENVGGVDVMAKRVVKLIEEELGEGIDGYLA